MSIQDIFAAKKKEISELVAAEAKAVTDAKDVAKTAKEMLFRQLEVTRQFAEECLKPENKTEYEAVFKTETGVALADIKSDNEYVPVVRLFFFPTKDEAKKNGVTINKRATVLHRTAAETRKSGKLVTVDHVLKPFKGIEDCVKDWRNNEDNNLRKDATSGTSKKDKVLKAVNAVTGQASLPVVSGLADGTYRIALVRIENGRPVFVEYVQEDKDTILNGVLSNVAKQHPSKRTVKISEEVDKNDTSLGGLLKRIAAFAKASGTEYGIHVVANGQTIKVQAGKRGTRNSMFGELQIPAREDVKATEFVLSNADVYEATTILALSKRVTMEITDADMEFYLPDDCKTFAELIADKDGAHQHERWAMDDRKITVPLPKPSFSLPTINADKIPNWLLTGINVDSVFINRLEELETFITKAMNKGADKRFKFTASVDKFSIRDLAADHSGYIAFEVTVENGPIDPVDLTYYTGTIPKAIEAVQSFADGKPILLSVAQNIAKLETDGVAYYVPVMDERDSFRTVNVAEWNEKKTVRRAG